MVKTVALYKLVCFFFMEILEIKKKKLALTSFFIILVEKFDWTVHENLFA